MHINNAIYKYHICIYLHIYAYNKHKNSNNNAIYSLKLEYILFFEGGLYSYILLKLFCIGDWPFFPYLSIHSSLIYVSITLSIFTLYFGW